MTQSTRIALIHALAESVVPAHAAFAELWPDAHIFDLLETSLATDLAHRGVLDEAMIRRFEILGDYVCREAQGAAGRTEGIVFTCSAFGPAIDRVKARLPIPVLRPNEAAFLEALRHGDRLALVVSFAPSRAALEAELKAMASAQGRRVEIESVHVEGALAALKRSDVAEHDRLIADAAAHLSSADAVVLGQFSLARARATVAEACGRPVVTTPHSAVLSMQALVASRRDERP